MLHVIATITVRPGRREAFLEEFRRLVPLVHAEEGCLDYEPTVDAATDLPNQALAGPDTVVVVERWASLEHLKAHLDASHMHAFRARVADLLAGLELRVLQPAADH